MDATLKSLVALVGAPDVEVRCAALLVLTQLESDDARVVDSVGTAIAGKNAVVRDFAVGYLERVRPRDGLSHLLPLLDSTDDALRQRTVQILCEYGAPAVTAARKQLAPDAPKRKVNAVIELCAAVRSAAALDLLFDFMRHEDFDVHRAACDALIAVVPALDAKTRADVWQRAEALMKSAGGQRAATVAAAKLFGALGDPRARKRLLPLLDREFAQSIRTHALGALLQCLRGKPLEDPEVDALFPLLEEDDEAGIVRPAITLLDDQTLGRGYLPRLNRLAESGPPAVRRFAVRKLGAFESAAPVKTLIGYLTDDSYARRDQAATSLKALPAARTALMNEFLACAEERKAWTLSEILLVHERGWKSSVLQSLRRKLESALRNRDDRLHTAYFHFLNTLDPAAEAAHVRERAEAARKKKDFPESVKWLALLRDSAAFDAETRFALAVAELKARRHAVIGAVRRHDPTLDLLRDLARTPFPLAEQLRKDRSLEAEELFYVAFNFAEGAEDERAVAEELLDHVASKYGRTKIGKAARNKLELLGTRRL